MIKQLLKIRVQSLFTSQFQSKNKAMPYIIGLLFIYLAVAIMMMFGGIFYTLVQPLHFLGVDVLYFSLVGLLSIVVGSVLNIFMAYQEIYDAKDNELLFALPIPQSDILISRLLLIYLSSFLLSLLIGLPAIVLYGYYGYLNAIQVIFFGVQVFFIPLIVIAISCWFSYLLGKLIILLNNKNGVIFGMFIAFFAGYFYVIQAGQEMIEMIIANGESITEAIKQTVFSIYHFGLAITEGNIVSFVIFALCMTIPCVITIYFLSKNFTNIALSKPSTKKKKYQVRQLKSNTVFKSLVQKELQLVFSNMNIFLNVSAGIFMVCMMIGLFIYSNEELNLVLSLFSEVVPVFALAIAAIASMNTLTSSSVSLEGKHLWISKSLPIPTTTILNSKLLSHLILSIPPQLLLIVVASFKFNLNAFEVILLLMSSLLFNGLFAQMGLIFNLLFPKFDWRNEILCVKQSISVGLSMGVGMASVFFIGFFATKLPISYTLYMYVIFGLVAVTNVICFYVIQTWGQKRFEEA